MTDTTTKGATPPAKPKASDKTKTPPAKPKASETVAETRVAPQIRRSEVRADVHAFTRHGATAPIGMTAEDAVTSHAWENACNSLRVGDEVRVTAADLSWVVNLLVAYRNGLNTGFRVLSSKTFDETLDTGEDALSVDRYDARFAGGAWQCFDTTTGAVIADRLPSKSSAVRAAEDHVASLR